MHPSPEPTVALAQAGQYFRELNLELDVPKLRRAIERGRVQAERRGGRWFVTERTAHAFARPLPVLGSAEQPAAA